MMKKVPYSHLEGIEPEERGDGPVRLSREPRPNCIGALEHALATLRLARALGVGKDDLVFPAPLTSLLCGRRIFFLRGWKEYESCIKGFNALGLLAEHAAREEGKLKRLSPAALSKVQADFLASRKTLRKAFSKTKLAAAPPIDAFYLALWKAFSRRTIVCSTSANLGISLHQALRALRRKRLSIAGKTFPWLNDDEGKLVIWCPDGRADFMSPEKSEVLRRLQAEKPRLTSLRLYINRQQRDPGALKEALESGGYFFPTNPQSRSELQNLLASALEAMALERNSALRDILLDPKISACLDSLGAAVVDGRVMVQSGVEGGMLGMAVPYLFMLEEALRRGDASALCLWNPASIGAALSAMVLCDEALRRGDGKAELADFFPRLAAFPRKRLQTRIHGVFDIANLQSLAQLFGVAVRRHQSGRQTAYVGLGSSSYANGNLCFDILRRSAEKDGAFSGKDGLHPATHTLNPVAQALIYAEDLSRAASAPGFKNLEAQEKVRSVKKQCRKPEPAGAAALAGYLLARLDAGTLSFTEIAYVLRAGGFTKDSFLEFCGAPSPERFIRQAGEEGAYMESLAQSLLHALDRDLHELRRAAESERDRSRREYRRRPLDAGAFEAKDPAVHIHLTGDNCPQPSRKLVAELLRALLRD